MRSSLAVALALYLCGCGSSEPESKPADARTLYGAACARCHGQLGRGGPPIRATGNPPRDFTDAAWQQSVSDDDIAYVITLGRDDMPPFANVLSKREIASLVGHVRAFRSTGAKEVAVSAQPSGGM